MVCFFASMEWLSNKLRLEIRKVFETRYKRKLNDSEVEEIAENLSGVMEEILKLQWKEKYSKNVDIDE